MLHVTDGSVCERAYVEWRLSLSQLCDDLTSHLATRLHSTSHTALNQDEESLNKAFQLPHVPVHPGIFDRSPDHPQRVLQVNYIERLFVMMAQLIYFFRYSANVLKLILNTFLTF